MTTQEEYIQGLRKDLKGFSPEEQEALIEEINSHIESGEEDPKMGKTLEQRRTKLMAELGSSKEMGASFKKIYRTDRFVDYLLIAIPYLLYPFLNMLYVSLIPKYPWADVRLDIILHLPFIAIGLWRRSALVTLFWLATIITQITSMLLVTQGFYGIPQTAFWFIILLGLLVLFISTIWKNRHDSLLIIYGLLPLLMCVVGSILAVIHPNTGASYGLFDKFLLNLYINIAGSGGGYLPFYGTLLTLAIFFLTTKRDIRWISLGLYGLVMGLSRDYVNLFDSTLGPMSPAVYLLYAILPLIIVFLGWQLLPSRVRPSIAE